MKKLVYLIIAAAVVLSAGCKKKTDETTSTLDNKDLVSQIFAASMGAYSSAHGLKSSFPINYPVDYSVNGPAGGNIHVTGSVTGSININDQTGEILGGTLLLGFTETVNSYAFTSNGGTYTMNGAPYISLAGTFTLAPGGQTFGTASGMDIGGGVRVTGPNFDQTININLSIIINSSGNGGHVSGTIGGVAVDYTF